MKIPTLPPTLSPAKEPLPIEIDGPADVRWSKIRDLRARIDSGTYRIPSTAIASCILDAITSHK